MGDDRFDQGAFDAWIAGDPGRRPVFEAMQRRLMGSDMDVALRAYERRGSARARLAAGAVAAVAIAMLGYAALPTIELQLARPQSYAATGNAVRTVDLEDGTRIALAAGARITVRYTGRERVVDLADGTLFANVSHDPHRPFRIETGNARIVDIGTSFEVTSRAGAVRVAVASGSVRFGSTGWFATPIDVSARQAAILDDSGLTRTGDVDPGAVARWRAEWVEYKGTPLRQVVADLQSLSPMPIEIADPGLADLPVSGRIRLTDPGEQLENLSIIHDFHLRRTGQKLILSKN